MINIKRGAVSIGILLGAFFGVQPVPGATRAAASCSSTDVQNAINAAVSGDTVTIPAGTCSWTSGVSISGKAITVQGQGSGRIIAYSPDQLSVGTGTKTVNIQSGLSISVGQTLRVSQNGSRGNWMQGTVAGYSGSVLTMNVTSVGGSGTARRWLVSTMPTTVITHNSGSTLFNITESTAGNVRLGGFKIAKGSGGGDGVYVGRNGSTGRAVVISNCWMEQGSGDMIYTNGNRGVVSNCSFDASPYSSGDLVFHQAPSGVTDSWTTPSTMGMADTNGESNFYFENSDFHAYNVATDMDNNSRAVFRYNVFDHAGIGTHGADSSQWGQRHFEYYNNTGVYYGYSDGSTFPLNWWAFVRGGTLIFANNILPQINSQDYPNKPDLNVTVMNLQWAAGPNPCWGAGTTNGAMYPAPRQVGRGYTNGTGRDGQGRASDSVTFVGDSEPLYIWGNRRSAGASLSPLNVGPSDFGQCSSPDRSSNYIVSGRDYINNPSTPKPGWTPYTYPHPLAGGVGGPSIDTNPPSAPGNPTTTSASASRVDLSWPASTDDTGVTAYRVERCSGASCTNFAQIVVVATTSYSDTGLAANTTYRYRVAAADAAGNWSGYSPVGSATTPAAPTDTTAPTAPASVSATATSTSQINVSWAASTDNVAVTGYRVERCAGSSCSNFAQVGTPSGNSYSDTSVAANTAYRYRVSATDAVGNWSGYSNVVSATTPAASGPAPLPTGNSGISALFPGDTNIRTHPDVLFADDFESYASATGLSANWNQVYQQQYARIATEAANVFAGTKALEFRVPQQSAEVSNALIRNLSPTQDVVFVRTYTRFDPLYNAIGSNHNGIAIKAQYCCPGVPANGTNKFYVDVENSREPSPAEPIPGHTKVYVYHPDQRSQWGDLWYPDGKVLPFDLTPGDFGPYFVPRPNFTPQLGRWYSYELMVKANTPGQRDGRIAIWIDGALIADFQNVRLRETTALKMDVVELGFHISSNTLRQNFKWYDNVVIAKSYIGPMATPGNTVAPPTNLSATVQQ